MSNANHGKATHRMMLFIFFSYIAVVISAITMKYARESLVKQYGLLCQVMEFGTALSMIFGALPFAMATAYIFFNGFFYKGSAPD